MPEVQAEIERYGRAGKWRGVNPIGPIGEYMKPVKLEYMGVCEWLVGKVVFSYIYFDPADKVFLQEILSRLCKRSVLEDVQIIEMQYCDSSISNNSIFQSAKVSVPGHYTVYDLFNYGHPMVERCLVEWCQIHKVWVAKYNSNVSCPD